MQKNGQKILIATTNPAKFAELSLFFHGSGYTLTAINDVGISDAVAETGATFEENALIKSRYYSAKSGLPAVADDGGFEIDALNGEPGVKSHRWIHGDRENSDDELIEYTLKRMDVVPEEKRGAQLRLVLACSLPDGRSVTSEASVRGIVATSPSAHRTSGFPYRSLLYLPQIGKYYDHSVLTPEETDRLNHRKHAVLALLPEIRKLLTSV